MKNKQVEELLNELKDKYSYEPYDTTGKVYTTISYEEGQLLLSYIEQLEKENKELKDIADEPIQIPSFLFDMTQELKIDELEKELQTTANKCKQLEKEIEEYQKELEKSDSITQSCIFNGKKDSEISYRKCLNMLEKLKKEKKDLENNRDKAIEYNEHLIEHAKYHLNLGHLKKMRKILKGDSDE